VVDYPVLIFPWSGYNYYENKVGVLVTLVA